MKSTIPLLGIPHLWKPPLPPTPAVCCRAVHPVHPDPSSSSSWDSYRSQSHPRVGERHAARVPGCHYSTTLVYFAYYLLCCSFQTVDEIGCCPLVHGLGRLPPELEGSALSSRLAWTPSYRRGSEGNKCNSLTGTIFVPQRTFAQLLGKAMKTWLFFNNSK